MTPYCCTWTLLITLMISEIGNGLPTNKLERLEQKNIFDDDTYIGGSGDDSLDLIDMRKLSYVNNRFALFLYQTIAENTTDENVFFSPYGISSALALTYMGTNGNTREQMREVMGFDSMGDDSTLHATFGYLNAAIQRSMTRSCDLESANRIFVMEDACLREQFTTDALNYYNTTAENLNFLSSRRGARHRINSWVRGQTEGKIKNLIGRNELNTMTVLVLVNAIYFKAEWEQKFKKTDTIQNGLFHISHNASVQIPMMHRAGRFPFGFDSVLQCDVIELPYSGKEVSMVIALPRDPDMANGLSRLENQLTPETFQRWSTLTSVEHKLDLYLPKFSLNGDLKLDTALKTMGVKDLFDVQKADLSRICKNCNDNTLYVSKVKHQACIDIDEEGSEASAATSVIMTGRSRGTEMNINRPFLFYIRHNPTQTTLFLGKVTRPSVRRRGGKPTENNEVLDTEEEEDGRNHSRYRLQSILPARRQPPMLGRQSRSRVGQLFRGRQL